MPCAFALAFAKAGRSKPAKIAMTTSNSIRVKPLIFLCSFSFQFFTRLAAVFAEEVGEFGKAMPNGNYWQNTYKCAV